MLRYTLVGDGSSDRALLHVIDWLLGEHAADQAYRGTWAGFPRGRPVGLRARIAEAIESDPCDLLFVHRDAEKEARDKRRAEILAEVPPGVGTVVCVVPVRMSEAWFLFDEAAIRKASGNPEGRVPLRLPPPRRVEGLPSPKEVLREALITASEQRGRRRDNADHMSLFLRLAALITDYRPLRSLSAFQAFEGDLKAALAGRKA